VEEHFVHADLLTRIDSNTLEQYGWPAHGTALHQLLNPPALADVGDQRIAAMEAAGISVQVLSVPGPGALRSARYTVLSLLPRGNGLFRPEASGCAWPDEAFKTVGAWNHGQRIDLEPT
jgi:hypothetical protein